MTIGQLKNIFLSISQSYYNNKTHFMLHSKLNSVTDLAFRRFLKKKVQLFTGIPNQHESVHKNT